MMTLKEVHARKNRLIAERDAAWKEREILSNEIAQDQLEFIMFDFRQNLAAIGRKEVEDEPSFPELFQVVVTP